MRFAVDARRELIGFDREQYQDHYTTLTCAYGLWRSGFDSPLTSVYRVSNESFTLDDFLRGDKEAQKEVNYLPFHIPTGADAVLAVHRMGDES